MTTKRLVDVDTTDRADGRVLAWDSASTTHVYTDPATAVSYTAPSVRAVGTPATGTGAVVPGLPTGHLANDILVLLVQSNNEAATAPAGYAQMGPHAGIGTPAAASATRLTAFWKRDGGAESDPTVADTGDHTLAVIVAVKDCITTGDPFLNVGATRKTTASTTGTGSAGATPVDSCMLMQAFAHALDSASAVFSGWGNASLASITEQVDTATADGNGGGIGVATGTKTTAGAFVATTVTETSTVDVGLAWIFLPNGIPSRAGFIDKQVFLTPYVSAVDTWTKPTGAQVTTIKGFGGGASGSAGRNAATAAGGGGGGGGGWDEQTFDAALLPATLDVKVGAGGAATANSDGAASNVGVASFVADSGTTNIRMRAFGGGAAAASASGSGGDGGAGGGSNGAAVTAAGAFADFYGSQPPRGGTGGTTAAAGSQANDFAGGAGAGGGTTQAASAGGKSRRGAGGGGGGRANTNVGTGGGSLLGFGAAGGSSAGASGSDGSNDIGGGGGAGGTSASGPGGAGGWPGGGGGGGGSQSGAQRGGAGGDGVVTIMTRC